ncbi:MAG: hypothetical protein QM778_21975 [Myxococcales bacterium]
MEGDVIDGGHHNNADGGGMSGPACVAKGETETSCSDGVDDDCDGFKDCLDPDCETKMCGADGSKTCLAGACLGSGALPALPKFDNLTPVVRGDTARIEFAPVKGAKDYRIYPLPADADVLVGDNGEVAVKNAIYRCAGALPRDDRSMDQLKAFFAASVSGGAGGFNRQEADSILGHVYLTPGAGRTPVYRVANPNWVGGYAWEYNAPPAKEFNGADYVTTTDARDALLKQGWRDDGIAFYTSTSATKPVYRHEDTKSGLSVLYTDGAEKQARDGQGGGMERFKVLAAAGQDTVPLYRIFYGYNNEHDVLAPGDAYRERVLYQGNMPVTSLTWPGLTGETTLVIEALDNGCPFPGGYIGAKAAPAADLGGVMSQPTITLDQARLSSGEVFVNGQYEPSNRPKPIARGYVSVKPEPKPVMDWFQSFDPGTDLGNVQTLVEDQNGTRVYHNDTMSFEFQAANANYSFGPLLGQLAMGSASTYSVTALGANAQLASDKYLHVTMSVDLPSTSRRYPQILITDTPIGDPGRDISYQVPMMTRLGPLDGTNSGKYHTLVVQTFFGQPELQVQFCDQRGWGVSAQCPMANIYGYHVGTGDTGWDSPWLPTPVMGEYVGMDRLVKFDVYASTDRVYTFIEDKPAGCAVVPAGRFPGGAVNVVFSLAAYHIEIDEFVTGKPPRQGYWNRYSVAHSDRKLDDLGVKSGESLPAWDETIMPCGSKYYGALLTK